MLLLIIDYDPLWLCFYLYLLRVQSVKEWLVLYWLLIITPCCFFTAFLSLFCWLLLRTPFHPYLYFVLPSHPPSLPHSPSLHQIPHFDPGSHLALDSPALEFVNAVTHVIGLDPVVTEAVTSLKRILLSQVKIVILLFVFELLIYCVCIQSEYFIFLFT